MRASPQACAAYFERLFLIRLRRVLSFARSFLATAFLIMFMPASGLGFVGAGMEEILSSSASISCVIASGRANCLDGSFLKFFARLKPDDGVRANASGRG
jgi:hypothetical protein